MATPEKNKQRDIAVLVEKLERERDRYDKMAREVAAALARELEARTTPHMITHRVKSGTSLTAKLMRDWSKIASPALHREFSPDILDVCGVRVLLYRDADVVPTTRLVEELFLVGDNDRLRKNFTEADGYRAYHRTVQLRESLLAEDVRLGNLTGVLCEVQVTALVDHIWNELEHDIKYKTPKGQPSEAQRAFLESLREALNTAGRVAAKLDAETQKQIAANLTEIRTPEELRRVLEQRMGRALYGDFERLLALLSALHAGALTKLEVDALPAEAEPLGAARTTVIGLDGFDEPDDVQVLVAAWFADHGATFSATAGEWVGRPSRLALLVRALHGEDTG